MARAGVGKLDAGGKAPDSAVGDMDALYWIFRSPRYLDANAYFALDAVVRGVYRSRQGKSVQVESDMVRLDIIAVRPAGALRFSVTT